MTCIVGLVDSGKIYVGGDSAGVAEHGLTIHADEKVFKKGSMLIGFTSSFRMGQLLRFKLVIPYHKSEMDTYEYMVAEFVEAVRTCLKEGGCSRIENNEESGGTFLVGYKGELFTIHSDFQVARMMNKYHAVGCGADIAKGSLFSSEGIIGMHASDRIRHALRAAETFNAGVRAPFIILQSE